jgi:hypothetical protein
MSRSALEESITVPAQRKPQRSWRSDRDPRGAGGVRSLRPLGQKIGSAERVFVNENCEPEYVRVRIGGLFGSKSVLIPTTAIEVDERRRALVLK